MVNRMFMPLMIILALFMATSVDATENIECKAMGDPLACDHCTHRMDPESEEVATLENACAADVSTLDCYVSTGPNEGHICYTVCPSDCTACDDEDTCTTCEDAFFNDAGSCVACSSDCTACTAADTCTTCASSFGVVDGACVACVGGDETTCTACGSGFEFDATELCKVYVAPEEPADESAVMYVNAILAVVFAVFAY